MKIAVIVNGISLDKKILYSKILPPLQAAFQVDVWETKTTNDAISLASKATDKRYDIIIAAGGDGTLNQVVHGVFSSRENTSYLPIVGLIPIGTGNDFARGSGITTNSHTLIEKIKSASFQPVDIGQVVYTHASGDVGTRNFINVADLGMGPEVVQKVLASDRFFGSQVAYFRAIISTFFHYKPMVVSATSTDWHWQGKLRTLAVANNKYYGQGLCIAPDAKTNDGLFQVFICGNVSVFDFIRYSGKLRRAKKITHPEVRYQQTKHLELTSQSPCAIEADGEFLGWLPATVKIMPNTLRFIL